MNQLQTSNQSQVRRKITNGPTISKIQYDVLNNLQIAQKTIQQKNICHRMKALRNYPQFTHFACLPFHDKNQRQHIHNLQHSIKQIVDQHYSKDAFTESNYNLAHVTLSMLVLHREDTRNKFREALDGVREILREVLEGTVINFIEVKHFSRFNHKSKKKEVSLLYLEIEKNEHYKRLIKAGDIFIRAMLKNQIIINSELKQMRIHYDHTDNLYKSEEYHLTLFRVKDVPEDQKFQQIFKQIQTSFKGLTFQCKGFEISIRNHYDQSGFYAPFAKIEIP